MPFLKLENYPLIRVMILDDHYLIRDGFRKMLEMDSEIVFCGEAGDVDEAVRVADQVVPDVALIDYSLRDPNRTGIDAIRDILARQPKVKIIVLTGFREEEILRQAIAAGAAGYVVKEVDNREELLLAIRKVAGGGCYYDPLLAKQVLGSSRKENLSRGLPTDKRMARLTAREEEVVELLAEGLSTRQIARKLHISEKTVSNNLTAIYSKFEVKDRKELMAYLLRLHRSSATFGLPESGKSSRK